jgi:hypothetical protein
MIDLTGGPFARGLGQAAAVPDRVPAIRAAVRLRLAEREAVFQRRRIRDFLAAQRRFTKAAAPEMLAEIAGLAAGTGLVVAELFDYLHLSVVLDLAGDPEPAADGCTAWAASHPVRGALVVKNRDFRQEHEGLQQLFRHRDPDWPHAVLTLGSLGSPGVYSSGINDAGLALADTHVATADHGIGWLRYFLMTHLLARCTDVDAALSMIRALPRAGGGCLVMADRRGVVAAVEPGHRTLLIDRRDAGWVARTNHWLGSDAGRPCDATSRGRLALVEAALADGMPETGEVERLMAAHAGEGAPALCRHGGADGALTLSAIAYDCASAAARYCDGQPCRGDWQPAALD